MKERELIIGSTDSDFERMVMKGREESWIGAADQRIRFRRGRESVTLMGRVSLFLLGTFTQSGIQNFTFFF